MLLKLSASLPNSSPGRTSTRVVRSPADRALTPSMSFSRGWVKCRDRKIVKTVEMTNVTMNTRNATRRMFRLNRSISRELISTHTMPMPSPLLFFIVE